MKGTHCSCEYSRYRLMIIGQSIVTSGIKLATMSDLDHGHKDHKTIFLCTYQFTDMHNINK